MCSHVSPAPFYSVQAPCPRRHCLRLHWVSPPHLPNLDILSHICPKICFQGDSQSLQAVNQDQPSHSTVSRRKTAEEGRQCGRVHKQWAAGAQACLLETFGDSVCRGYLRAYPLEMEGQLGLIYLIYLFLGSVSCLALLPWGRLFRLTVPGYSLFLWQEHEVTLGIQSRSRGDEPFCSDEDCWACKEGDILASGSSCYAPNHP